MTAFAPVSPEKMLFSVCFLVFVWCTNGARINTNSEQSCDGVLPFFHAKNITYKPAQTSQKGRICGGHCCDNDIELQLQNQGQKDLADLLRHNSRSLLGPLNRTSVLLQNHVRELVNHSEARTLYLFNQIYGDESPNEPIEQFYSDIRRYVTIDEEVSIRNADEVVRSVDNFFSALFPLAYQKKAPEHSGEFAANYRQCLIDHFDAIEPFAAYPKTIARQLSNAIETSRWLFHALRVGASVLTQADDVIVNDNRNCHVALLSMMSCAKCQGLRGNVKPCSGYCLNVMRGCLSRYVAELDSPWNGYVEGVENLLGMYKRSSDTSVDTVIKNLHSQISEAVMHFLNKIIDIDHKVKMNCKLPEFVPAKTTESVIGNRTKAAPSRYFPHFPDTQVSTLLSILSKTRGFYGELADNLCGDDTFADQRDKKCWNGERVGEYTKTVIGTAANAQMYNPEVKPVTYEYRIDSKIAALVDKLRHVHHVAVASAGQNYVEGMQRDGTDGSGSGNGPDIEDDDDEPLRGSGSGNGQGVDEDRTYNTNIDEVVPLRPSGNADASACAPTAPATLLTAVSLLILTFLT